jgi:glycosyltransferase involved in cell wall biosynthesis
MRILTVLTYYRPHTSGLTIYASGWRALRRGHEVTVMTTQYDRRLPLHECMDGVDVRRVPVAVRLSKGVIAPTFGLAATRLVWDHDVVQMHLPQFDAPGVALRGRLFRRPAVLTYHCDLRLPPGLLNRFVNLVIKWQNNMAGILADHIITYTRDYADHSSYLSRYRSKLGTILPPVELPQATAEAVKAFSVRHRTAERRPVIGMAARFAAEKGVEVLLDALPSILQRYPSAQVLFAGQSENVMGEQAYANRLMPRIRELERLGHWKFLGNLNPDDMAAFYRTRCAGCALPELHGSLWAGADRSHDERHPLCGVSSAWCAYASANARQGPRGGDRRCGLPGEGCPRGAGRAGSLPR